MSRKRRRDRILAGLGAAHARWVARRFFRDAKNAERVQDRLLQRLVRTNCDSVFGQDHQFDRIRRYEDFAARIPIRKYQDLQPYIDRVRHGEVRALFGGGQQVLMFALTSGTTAEPKHIPVTRQSLADWRAGWNIWGLKALLDHPGTLLRDIVQVTSPMDDHRSPAGIPCGAVTGLLASTQKPIVRRFYVAPLAVAEIRDSHAKYYTIMRLGVPRDVAFMVTANPATLLRLARVADQHRETLIRDVADGTLCADFDVPRPVRDALRPGLRPDRDAARRLERILKQYDRLLPKHYWNLGFRAHWIGGTMGLYQSQFPEYFGDVPARDIGLLASEGRMSIPLEDGVPAGVLAVGCQFFEFIPAEDYGTPNPTVLRIHQLEERREYFLVVTTAGGCYRYDLGDRVRVTGRVGRAPLIEFLSRDAHTASMAGEKLTEDQVVLAMRKACEVAGGDPVVDFVLAARWSELPYYCLYVESQDVDRLSNAPSRLDDALAAVNLEYRARRESLRLGPVEIAPVAVGALGSREHNRRLRRTGMVEQYKRQYLLPRPGEDQDLVVVLR